MSAPFTWISVKDELPGMCESVLVHSQTSTPWSHMTMARRIDESKWKGDSNFFVKPTHWMRVEPPKEDK